MSAGKKNKCVFKTGGHQRAQVCVVTHSVCALKPDSFQTAETLQPSQSVGETWGKDAALGERQIWLAMLRRQEMSKCSLTLLLNIIRGSSDKIHGGSAAQKSPAPISYNLHQNHTNSQRHKSVKTKHTDIVSMCSCGTDVLWGFHHFWCPP